MSTPWGRYKRTRLPFGTTNSYSFRRLQIISIANEILVPGYGFTEAKARVDDGQKLIAVLERFKKHHVKINVNKMKFLVREATFIGHLITIVQAILTMPNPTDKAAARRFFGAINYLSKFCPQLSNDTLPLLNLTKEDVAFLWSSSWWSQNSCDQRTMFGIALPCCSSGGCFWLWAWSSPSTIHQTPLWQNLWQGFSATTSVQLKKSYLNWTKIGTNWERVSCNRGSIQQFWPMVTR